jgi:hypothetical protein
LGRTRVQETAADLVRVALSHGRFRGARLAVAAGLVGAAVVIGSPSAVASVVSPSASVSSLSSPPQAPRRNTATRASTANPLVIDRPPPTLPLSMNRPGSDGGSVYATSSVLAGFARR